MARLDAPIGDQPLALEHSDHGVGVSYVDYGQQRILQIPRDLRGLSVSVAVLVHRARQPLAEPPAHVGERPVDDREREESPEQHVHLHAAHRAVESITLDREVMHERDRLAPRFAELIYNGFWYAPEMEFLRAAIDASQKNVTGEARVRLYKGSVQVTGRRSPVSLYSESLSSFEKDGGYDQRDAGAHYYLGSSLTAVDIYSATFMALFKPLPPEQCPIPDHMRPAFEALDADTEKALDPILFQHRDRIYAEHLELPLTLS